MVFIYSNRSWIESDKFVKPSICNVKNMNDDYCLLYCYFKHKQKLNNGRRKIDARPDHVRELDELFQTYPDI